MVACGPKTRTRVRETLARPRAYENGITLEKPASRDRCDIANCCWFVRGVDTLRASSDSDRAKRADCDAPDDLNTRRNSCGETRETRFCSSPCGEPAQTFCAPKTDRAHARTKSSNACELAVAYRQIPGVAYRFCFQLPTATESVRQRSRIIFAER